MIAPVVLFLYAFKRFACGGCSLNTSIMPYLAFKRVLCVSCIFYHSYTKASLNAFYNILLELVFDSDCV